MFEIVLIIVFIVMLLCIFDALEHTSIGSTAHRWVMAACVSALSIMGLIRFVKCDDATSQKVAVADQWINSLLLPYAALAVAVVVILTGLLVRRCFHHWARRRPDEKPSRLSQLAQMKNQRKAHSTFKDKK